MIRLTYLITIMACYFLLSCHSSDQEKIHQENLSLQNEVMLDFMEREYEELKRRTEKLLNNPAKYEYLPILTSLEKVEVEAEEISSQLDTVRFSSFQRSQIKYLNKVLDRCLKEIMNIHSDLLNQYGEIPFGLRENEIDKFLMEFEDTIRMNFNDWKYNNLSLFSTSYKEQASANLEWKLKLMHYKLYKYFVSFSGGRSTASDWYYHPVISPRKCMVRTDEVFEADVSIGTYAAVDPKYFKLFVNGDSVKVNDDGIANLRIPSENKIGIQILKLEAIIQNPDNGRSYSMDGVFEYEVIKK